MPGESNLPGEWWYDELRRNYLKGIPGDENNPPLLSNEDILYYLYRVPRARADYLIIMDIVTPEERARLQSILDDNPNVRYMLPDWPAEDKKFADATNRTIPSILFKGY